MGQTKRKSGLLGLVLVALAGIAVLLQATGIVDLRYPVSREPREWTLTAGTLNEFCVDCHDPVLQSGGLVLKPAALADVGEHAEIWEKVVHKLRLGTMPPVDEPRPQSEVYDQIGDFLATSLDAAAAANPNPGQLHGNGCDAGTEETDKPDTV